MGLVLFHFGWKTFQLVAFPLAFLWFMVPLPGVVFYGMTLDLQELSSRSAAFVLEVLGIPVLRDGNVLHLSDISLGVTEACSGIRSLISLLALATGWAYVSYARVLPRCFLVLAAIPIAIIANAVRIVLTGIIGQNVGIEYAEGFFHSFSGWVIFLVALVCLSGIHKLMQWTSAFAGRETL
jgi:exosortase